MRSEIRARLLVREMDPDIVHVRLGVTADFAWRVGDAVKDAPSRHRQEDLWGIESKLPATAHAEAHVIDVLNRLTGAEDRLRALDPATIEVVLSVWSYGGDRPDLSLSRDTIQRLADLGAGFAVDLFVV